MRPLSGFPSLPPSGRSPLVPPQVPGAIRSVTPQSPPPPVRRNNGMLGFFDEPPSEPGDAAKTELFQRGKVQTGWDDDAADTAEATEIFSALTNETGDEGFADDTSSRTRKR
ncbi:MAG: hypothetical protein H0V89_09590 [Deltaproteobacteria bacterium]|nr:hypothetical protein [Deltaproteobacteria bacterium]